MFGCVCVLLCDCLEKFCKLSTVYSFTWAMSKAKTKNEINKFKHLHVCVR